MLNVFVILHFCNLFMVLAASLVVGIWGLILFFGKRAMHRAWQVALMIVAGLSLLQGLFGVILLLMGQKPGTQTGLYYLHYVYGAIVALALPVALTYATGGKNPRRDILIFSLAALVLFAAGFRAWMTGPPLWPSFTP